jgi:hypothetical protein
MTFVGQDAKIGADKNVIIENGDIVLTDGTETVEQSIAIGIGNAIARNVGSPVTSENLTEIQLSIAEALESDPILDSVTQASIERITTDGAITFNVRTSFNDGEFELTVSQ